MIGRFPKHGFPYPGTYFQERSRPFEEIFRETSRGQEGFYFRYAWKQWNGKAEVIPQILRQVYPDASLQTTKHDTFTLVEVEQKNTPRLIIAFNNDQRKDENRRPIDQILATYAISTMLGKPDVLSQALLAIENDTYLAGILINYHHLGPRVEYVKDSLPLKCKNENDLTNLWNVVSFPGELQSPFIPVLEEDKKLKLLRCLGSGATGTVHEACYPDSKERWAVKIVKIINDREIFSIGDLKEKTAMRSVKDVKIRTTVAVNIWVDLIMTPMGKMFYPIVYVPQEYQAELKLKHFREILHEVQEMHKAGFVHRDLSLTNLILDCKTQKVRLVDYGSVCNEGVACTCKGSQCTASQRSLLLFAEDMDQDAKFIPRDDLESLYKAYLIWKNPGDPLAAMLSAAVLCFPVGSGQYHKAVHMIWVPYVEPIEKMEYAELYSHLESIFTKN